MEKIQLLYIISNFICLIFAVEIICVVILLKLEGKYIDAMGNAFTELYNYFRYNLMGGFGLLR